MVSKRRVAMNSIAAIAAMVILLVPAQIYAQDLYTWAKSYGSAKSENVFRSVARSADGGYLIAGDTNSFGAGSSDVLVIKLNEGGGIDWQKTYGGSSSDTTRAMVATSDGGYALASRTSSFGSGGSDFWIFKIDDAGEIQWQKAIGGSGSEIPHAIQQTADGGFVIGGLTRSFGALYKDYYVVKLDSSGELEWQKRYGGESGDVIRFVKQVSDGGYLVAGYSHSFDLRGDILLLKLDSDGDVEWQKRYGGAKFEEPCCILEVPGGYIVMEQSSSFTGSTDAWIFKIDFEGDFIWQRTFGGPGGMDELSSAELTEDGGFVAAGETRSNSIPSEDFWLVKFDSNGMPEWQKRYGGDSNIDSAESLALTPEGGTIVVGTTRTFGQGGMDIWAVRANADGNLLGSCVDSMEVHNTAAKIKNTNGYAIDTDVEVADTNGNVKNTSAKVLTSNVQVGVQCSATAIES